MCVRCCFLFVISVLPHISSLSLLLLAGECGLAHRCVPGAGAQPGDGEPRTQCPAARRLNLGVPGGPQCQAPSARTLPRAHASDAVAGNRLPQPTRDAPAAAPQPIPV